MANSPDGKVVIDVSLGLEKFKNQFKSLGTEAVRAGKKAGKGIQDPISSGADKASAKVGGLGKAISKIGAIVGTAFVGRKLIDFGKQSIELGSNVAEVQNVVDTAFGNMAYKIEEFSKTSIENFGMSKLAAKKTASTYMAMARGMQIPADAASDMAIALTGLSGDVASFFNISQELADTKLKSIFTGETETLKDLGVVMTQANLKAFALEKGITKNIDAMSQAELVSLRYKFVTEQLALANGDFAKTQNSWANQTRILSMQWQEFMSIIGQALIQVLAPAVRMLNQMVALMIQWANSFSAAVTAIFGGQAQQTKASAEAIGAVADASNSAADGQEALAKSTKKAAKEAKGALAPYDQLNVLQEQSANNADSTGNVGGASAMGGGFSTEMQEMKQGEVPAWIGKTREAVAHMWDELEPSFRRAVKKFEKPLSDFKKNLKTFWQSVSTLGNPLLTWFNGDFTKSISQTIDSVSTILAGMFDTFNIVFGDILNRVIAPFLGTLVNTILPVVTQLYTQIMPTLETWFTEIKTLFDTFWTEGVAPAFDSIMRIWDELWVLISEKWNQYGKPIFEGVREAFRQTGATLKSVWDNILKPVWDTFMSTVDWLWDKHLKPFVAEFLDFVGVLWQGGLDIYNKFIAPIVQWLVEKLAPPIKLVAQIAIEVLGTVFGTLVDVARGIIESLKGIINFIVGVFTGDWGKAWTGIKQTVKGIWDGIYGVIKGTVNLIIDVINAMIRSMVSGLNSVIRTANKIKFTPPDWVPGLGGKTFGFNISEVKAPQIPKLAQGAVIPPNREFMAVLGDQRNGRNLEAPENLIRQIFREEFGNNAGGDWHIYIMMPDGTIKAETIITAAQRLNQRSGKTVIAVDG